MQTYLNIAETMVAVVLVGVILLQVRGLGSGGFGPAEASFRPRRGIEKTLFQFTIVLAVLFIVISILSVRRFI